MKYYRSHNLVIIQSYINNEMVAGQTAANVAALAAVGGDDVLSKWKLMAEEARYGASTSDFGKAIVEKRKLGRIPKDGDGNKKGSSTSTTSGKLYFCYH